MADIFLFRKKYSTDFGTAQPYPVYRLAGLDVACDQAIPELEPFRLRDLTNAPARLKPPEMLEEHLHLTYHGPGWVGNEWREVQAWYSLGGYEVEISGIGKIWVSADGKTTGLGEAQLGANEDMITQTLLGPALILALALNGVWCLHASAVERDGFVRVISGDSGAGKSTLARWLGNEGNGWQRIGDDILPVRLSGDSLLAMPYFPQLKLPLDRQPAFPLLEELPIAAFYNISVPDEGKPNINRIEIPKAALAFVRHTVASRLFGPDLLRQHLKFSSIAGAMVPTWQLDYPHRPEIMAEMDRLISENPG